MLVRFASVSGLKINFEKKMQCVFEDYIFTAFGD